ncbi:hypothetical protein EST38_g3494 [Candolleomyces aberdarensis]|uniref:Carboxylic ester hydrolase n=1 Tax=Candolleomyces aberdarensis TaxID=2316362 RepID=A0A4V1Q4K0_9AGAR|nr:hypothetical protein EST38_g3494 [Candolleomyces aberdarensis]
MLATIFLLFSALATAQALPELQFGRTALSGQEAGPNVEFFGGIPFAEPPTGALRLRPPIPKPRLNVTSFDASQYGKACIQPQADPSTVSEDCLTINIHRPKGVKPSSKLPVLFWTYGGAFILGSSNTYKGSEIAERSVQRGTPIIFVNFNYRLGPLGFPQGNEAETRKSLNLGILDQMAALEWVQANIGAFGGDKNKVTIFGESAGAMMTGILYLNPKIERLARGAIMQSGSPNSAPAFPARRNEPAWHNFVRNVPSCSSLSASAETLPCLRNATSEEIATAVLRSVVLRDLVSNLIWTPTLDPNSNSVYTDLASRLYSKGRSAGIPFIAGTNLDEGTYFASHDDLSDQALKDNLAAISSPRSGFQDQLGSAIDRVLALYPDVPAVGSPYGTGDELFGLPRSYKRHASIRRAISYFPASW